MTRYWTAVSDRDWQDSVGMHEEQDEFEEEPEMAVPKWTAGPWRIYEPPDPRGSILIVEGNRALAGTYQVAARSEERANAHLIAAGPDLYGALDRIAEAFFVPKNVCSPAIKAAILDALNALAKAKGET